MLDILLSDISSSDLYRNLSKILNKEYLSNIIQESDNVRGILFRDFQWLICTMTLNIKGIIKNVHFLVNTGLPRTFICDEVLKSFNLHILFLNGPFMVRLNKRMISVKVSQYYFKELVQTFRIWIKQKCL